MAYQYAYQTRFGFLTLDELAEMAQIAYYAGEMDEYDALCWELERFETGCH